MASHRAFEPLIASWVEALKVKNYSKWTIIRRQKSILRFAEWCRERDLTAPKQITRPILERYIRSLYYYRKKDGTPMAFASQSNHVSCLRLFFRWLVRENYLGANPASDLEAPRVGQRLPKEVLTISEVEAILSVPDLTTDLGIRDRAILETLYSTGIRRTELTNLDVTDLDIQREVLRVRAGKGNKDRIIPIGERALDWVDKYLLEVRPGWVVDPALPALFISHQGGRLVPNALGDRVTKYINKADIQKKGSCHIFRHTMATVMLEGGADLRFVQQMLGHANLEATKIYTHVSIKQLKKVHDLSHPSAKRERFQGADNDEA